MSDILCITNRKLCSDDFLIRIEKIAKEHPHGIILREKDLSKQEYLLLAKKVLGICKKYDTLCILHSHADIAKELNCTSLHLPLACLRALNMEAKNAFKTLGASCHSIEEAKEAESLGCTYIVVGHIFETDCKKGLKGRGLKFLSQVCTSVSIPVYAIGGIRSSNMVQILQSGADGVCVMSGIMTCDEPEQYLSKFSPYIK